MNKLQTARSCGSRSGRSIDDIYRINLHKRFDLTIQRLQLCRLKSAEFGRSVRQWKQEHSKRRASPTKVLLSREQMQPHKRIQLKIGGYFIKKNRNMPFLGKMRDRTVKQPVHKPDFAQPRPKPAIKKASVKVDTLLDCMLILEKVQF